MKISTYNILFPYKGNWILFNCLSQKLVLLNVTYKVLYENSLPQEVETSCQDFYSALVAQGMYVSDDVDELAVVRDLIHECDFDSKQFHLMINPTLNCNFRCWYCYEEHKVGSTMSEEVFQSTKNLIFRKIQQERFQEFKLSFFGGEPLLYYQKIALPLIKYTKTLADINGTRLIIHFTTNGYLLSSERIKELKALGTNSFQITLDGDEEQHNSVRFPQKGNGSYDKILKNIQAIVALDMTVILRINYTHKNIDSIPHVIQDLLVIPDEYRKNIILSLNRVWQDEKKDLSDKIEKIVSLADQHGFRSLATLRNGLLQYACYADKYNQALVNFDGLVYKCNARDFTEDSADGVLTPDGEIAWNSKFEWRMNIRLKNKPCLSCKILPLCIGACRQYAMEHSEEDYCIFDFDEEKKLSFVKSLVFNHSVVLM